LVGRDLFPTAHLIELTEFTEAEFVREQTGSKEPDGVELTIETVTEGPPGIEHDVVMVKAQDGGVIHLCGQDFFVAPHLVRADPESESGETVGFTKTGLFARHFIDSRN